MVQKEVVNSMTIILAAKAVSKTYKPVTGQIVEALQDVSFALSEGEVLGIVGPSGCGKSTLLRLIAGVEAPTAGVIQRLGHNGKFRVGYIFQDSALMRWRTVFDNIKLPLEVIGNRSSEKVRDLIRMVGLLGFEKAYPVELSGGMQRRTAIARALVHEPNLLLMDEPFTGVDELTKETLETELIHLIRTLGVTGVLVTHDIEEAVYMADRILVFSPRPGKVISEVRVPLLMVREPTARNLPEFSESCSIIREQLNMLRPFRAGD
jgi:NitT/TauT family transport system ATP-binding protein